jgi:Rnl2 family RNA ligase
MIVFKKYNSIENTFDKEFLEKVRTESPDNMQFVVQEKVHGANFSFITDGETVYAGKRTGLIEADEKFYDYEKLLERYNEKVLSLFSAIKQKYPDTVTVTVYGEIFGGNYPHHDVKNDSKIICIQKGVYYSPYHEFYAYDLYVTGTASGRYLSVAESNLFFEQQAFFYAKTLFRGTLEDCLQYSNEFPSLISVWMGLPPIDDNVCEGVVIRPEEVVYLHNGSRLMLKNKNSRFAEKKSVKKRQPKLLVEVSYSEVLNNMLEVVEEYVTENRMNNVTSKIGHVSIPKDTGKLIGLFSKDILDDFMKEHSGNYAKLEKSEQKIINKHINMLATDLIKKMHFKM